jgi:4-hydroxy-tetrahydrodipicolinate synthase
VSATLAGRLRDQFPGTVVGVKDSSGDPESLRAFISAMPDGSVFAGTELLLVPGLEDGAVGVISAFANLNAPHIRTAYESRAPADMGPLSDARSALGAHPTIPALKSVIAHRLGDAAWRAVRPPLRALPAEVGATLAAGLPSA